MLGLSNGVNGKNESIRMKTNTIEIHYELSGKKGAPVVVLSHSLASSLVMWNPQMDALNPYFQALRYDMRGHGKSEVISGPYTLELLADDVIGFLDVLKIDRVHYVGLSVGGMIGQSLALNYAHRLRSLALCDTASIIPQEAQPIWQERIDKALTKGMEAQVDETMERWFTPAFLKQGSPMLDIIRKQILATSAQGYIGCAEAIRKLNYLNRLSEIKIPTLIMVGEDDPGTPVSASKTIHERIANSKLVILPSARHLSNIEQKEAFNTALLTFLKDQ
jgi:3-oxoadipate enol-lactonase